jgi:serine-type D-Ala-D-Ala carboxypeptidase/endopeptidase (penicillin-binding protein 4)
MTDRPPEGPNEPLAAEPPIMSVDPAFAAPAPAAVPGSALDGGPLPGAATAPSSPGHRGRWLVAAGLVALLGVAAVVVGIATADTVTVADGAPPAQRVSTAVLSARRVPEYTARPVATRAVQAATAPVIARAPASSCVQVDDGSTTVVGSKETTPLAPASNMKLLTTSAVLDVLGADAHLSTEVAAATPPAGGTVAGDLYLIGGGDPLLSTATYEATQTHGAQPQTSMEMLADKVVAAGVRQVTGSVVGDGSRYDGQRSVPGWPARFVTQGIVANLGALMVNDAWTVDPVDPKGSGGAAAADPAAHAASVLTQLLRARGVQVGGPPVSGTAPAGATTIVEVPSLTVRELVDETLAFSDNTSAELLLKELGHAKGGAGTTEAGLAVVRTWLTDQRLPADGVRLVDGSGLSDQDRLTCRLLADLLARGGPDGALAQGLARPGRPGTLDDRFTGADLRDRLRAKTGTLKSVAALSGWLDTTSGRPLRFSILENTDGRDVQAADLSVQGDLLRALLSYPQSPPADQLGPRAPVAT